MSHAVDTAIVGGGISGLACAAILHEHAPDSVMVFEADNAPGGKMQSTESDGFLYERGPTTLLDNVEEARALVDMLGLTPEWHASHPDARARYIWRNGRRHAVPQPPFALCKAVTTQLLSPAGKLRMLREPWVRTKSHPEESLRSFADRRLGAEATRALLEPMVSGIHAADISTLEIASAFPRLVAAEKEYGNLMPGMLRLVKKARGGKPRRKTHMRSFPKGLQQLPEAIAARLGPSYHGRHTVETLGRDADGYRLTAKGPAGAREVRCRRLVLAAPAGHCAALLGDVAEAMDLANELRAIDYNSVAVVHLGVSAGDIGRDINGFGHLCARDDRIRTLGTIYVSSLFPGRAPDGQALLSTFVGGALDGGAVELDDAELVHRVQRDLGVIVDYHGTPSFAAVVRWPHAFPRYSIGHAARRDRIEKAAAGIPGLHLVGNFMRGISVNDCVRTSTQVAREILAERGG